MKYFQIAGVLIFGAIGLLNFVNALFAFFAFGATYYLIPGLAVAAVCAIIVSAIVYMMRNPSRDPDNPPGAISVLRILGIVLFGAIGLFTGGCAIFFLAGSQGTGGGYLEVQLIGLGIAIVCAIIVSALIFARR